MKLKRRHLKDNVKVFIKRTIIFIISAIMLWGAIICIKDINNPNNDKQINSENTTNFLKELIEIVLIFLYYFI